MTDFLTVSELVNEVKNAVESQFGFVVIKGEVSNLSTAFSGHTYFSLKDKNAQIRCVLFKFQKKSIPYNLEEGKEFIIWGRLNIYEKRADLTVIVNIFTPFGEGKSAIELKMLKEKLHKEGLFDEIYKKTLPDYIFHIGVVTSKTGAAIHDIIKVGRSVFPNLKITLFPALVQGKDAEKSIVKGIEILSHKEEIDAIIVGRGGGSKEDLSVFNSEKIARTVFASPKPVISAVGHETDLTILDLVASYSVSTPSSAAKLVTDFFPKTLNLIGNFEQDSKNAINNNLHSKQFLLDNLINNFPKPQHWIEERKYKLENIILNAKNLIEKKISKEKSDFLELFSQFQKFSPQKPLENGFTLIFQEGKIVKTAKNFNQKKPFKIKFIDKEIQITNTNNK